MNAFQHAVHDYLVLFAMVNAFGNLPILWELTHSMDRAAKARAALTLVRELESDTFRIILQPRGGLDYFSPLHAIEAVIPHPYAPEGLHQVFAMGCLPVPYLWECREESAQATRWQTRQIRGGIRLVADAGGPISAKARAAAFPKQEY